MSSPRFAVEDLLGFARRILGSVDVPADTADLVARSLLAADRAGVFSHGLLRLPLYVRTVQAGGIDPAARPAVVHEHGAVTVLDAGGAFGQLAMQQAVDTVLERVPEHGLAAVAVQNSTHYGAGLFWTEQLVARGVLGILTSTTGPTTAPFGGSQRVLGTNPLTMALPSAGANPLTADLATSAGALGKIVAARNEGQQIPAGWAVDASGAPTTDPAAAIDGGALLPFGGHKGSGISVLIEALSAALTSAAFAYQTVDIWQDPASRMNTGHLLIGLDVSAFGDADRARERVAELQESVRTSHPTEPIPAPGDLEYGKLAANADAVELAGSTVAQLTELAAARGVELPRAL